MSDNIDEVLNDDDLDLSALEPEEVEEMVKAFSTEGLAIRAKRKKVRYSLYRLRTEAEGKGASGVDEDFKESFESQPGFTGWRFFATDWDVSFDDPMLVVSRLLSEQEEWDAVVRSKFPQITHDGKVLYPDMAVKKKIDKEVKSRKKGGGK